MSVITKGYTSKTIITKGYSVSEIVARIREVIRKFSIISKKVYHSSWLK